MMSSFTGQLALSTADAVNAAVASILAENIPGALQCHQAAPVNDRRGTDFWVEHARGDHLSVDVKIRTTDFSVHPNPNIRADDLALERWSVVDKRIPGWPLDDTKRTDFVLWFWVDTGRWFLCPFMPLVAAFRANVHTWYRTYPVHRQTTDDFGGYSSEIILVPRKVVWDAMYAAGSGHTGASA
ncbi:hypothetical protein ACFL6U_09170 [Planctomycetota bacterium]